jgi:hypothetical protein
MAESLQHYGLWILLIGGVFLMHRLGIGFCGGHRHKHPRETASREGPPPTPGTGDTKKTS